MSETNYRILLDYPTDRTWDVHRTPDELRSIANNCLDVTDVPRGYPRIQDRLYVSDPDTLLALPRPSVVEMHGERVWLYDLPPGHDTTPEARAGLLADQELLNDLLYGEPDFLNPYGEFSMGASHPSAERAFVAGCRSFDTRGHMDNRIPLIPGFRGLVSLATYTEDGEIQEVGLPTNLGSGSHAGLAPMADGATFRLEGNRLKLLLYKRPTDAQSGSVMATPGGYARKSDGPADDKQRLFLVSTARRTLDRTGLDISEVPGLAIRAKLPASSFTTAHFALDSWVVARVLPDNFPLPERLEGRLGEEARWFDVEDICRDNATGGYSGTIPEGIEVGMWTTHLELASRAIQAILDPYNKDRLGITWEQFGRIAAALGISASSR